MQGDNRTPTDENLKIGREPEVQSTLLLFEYHHLLPHLKEVSAEVHDLMYRMLQLIPGIPTHDQFKMGMQKLLEAKDCFVRARNLQQ